MRERRWAACFHAFGPEARGAASRGDVVVSDEPLDYPVSREVGVLVALTQDAPDRHAPRREPGGTLGADLMRVCQLPAGDYRSCGVEIYRAVQEAMGTEQVGDVAALRVISALVGVVSAGALAEVVRHRFRGPARPQNLRAVEVGPEVGRWTLARDGEAP
ncbi:MAG: hypothetical protein C4304_08135 [candidate division GAL15 bacterium]